MFLIDYIVNGLQTQNGGKINIECFSSVHGLPMTRTVHEGKPFVQVVKVYVIVLLLLIHWIIFSLYQICLVVHRIRPN